MKAPVYVLLISPFPPPPGGIGRWAEQITQAGSMRPADVIFRCLDISPRWRAVYDMSPWKRVVGGGLQMLHDFLRFLKMIRRRPDVVHLNSHGQLAPFRDIPILAVCRRKGIPSVYHMRFGRIPEIARFNTLEWKLLRRALALAHNIVAIDRQTFETLRNEFPDGRIRLVPNCVDMSQLPKVPNEPGPSPYLAYLGHVIPTKGIRELMEAWRDLSPSNWRLRVAGTVDDNYRDELQRMSSPGAVEFLGELSHQRAMELLAASEGLVLPSYTEGFPNVVAEAMALGKPTVATDVGAIPDMLDGGCGLVIRPRNVKELGAALDRLISDPPLRRAMGVQARVKVQTQYSIDRVLEQLLLIWREPVNAPDGV